MLKDEQNVQIKVRQPLSSLSYTGTKLEEFYETIIAEEVNVKQVTHCNPEDQNLIVQLDKNVTPELRREGIMREIVRVVQNARKDAGLNVDDRIVLSLVSDSELLKTAIFEHSETIASETLAESIDPSALFEFVTETKIEGESLRITLQKA